jgi:tRNA nucleotidyltransferase (CCA-adding enzyme)
MFDKFKENAYFKEVSNFLISKKLFHNSYLVGGTIRDLLLKKEIKDLDFAINANTIELAKVFSKTFGGSFVLLDENFSIGRVVKDNVTIDFSQLRGDSIETDLSERDFTINAMAVPLSMDRIIDPFEGMRDIKNKIIRIVSEENLKKDPLRVLRAYRFHATLEFDIDEKTREALKKYAPLMKITAKERVREELWKIFSVERSYKTIKLIIEDDILRSIFKTSDYLTLKPHIEALKIAEELLINSKREIKHLNCFKFVILFDFHSSDLLKNIKPSRKEQKFCEDLIKAGTRIKKIETLLDKVRFIKDFEHILQPALIYGISRDPLSISRKWFYEEIEDFYKRVYLRNKKKLPMIKGDDLLNLGFEPSPLLGEILERIEILILVGKISTKEQAIEEIKKHYFKKYL